MDKKPEEVKVTCGTMLGGLVVVLCLLFALFYAARSCEEARLEAMMPRSAASLRMGQKVWTKETIPSGHLAWRDLAAARRFDELNAKETPEASEAATKMMLKAERQGQAVRIPEYEAVTVKQVEPATDGFYYVQIEWQGCNYWLDEVELEF